MHSNFTEPGQLRDTEERQVGCASRPLQPRMIV
jgi:hypothetical protein